jgi:hypothetical protein
VLREILVEQLFRGAATVRALSWRQFFGICQAGDQSLAAKTSDGNDADRPFVRNTILLPVSSGDALLLSPSTSVLAGTGNDAARRKLLTLPSARAVTKECSTAPTSDDDL